MITNEMIEAAKQAYWKHHGKMHDDDEVFEKTLAAALALIPGEPVAWRYRPSHSAMWQFTDSYKPTIVGWVCEPLYAAPASLPVVVKVKPLEWKHDGHSYYAYCGVTDVRWTARNIEEMAQKDETRATRIRSALSSPLGGMEEKFDFIPCPCTTFEQDENCPVGYPSLLCSACEGKGVTTIETVVALAAEMLKVAEQVDELEDPFAAWESIELLKSAATTSASSAGGPAFDMSDAEIHEWIQACNHEPAKASLRHYLALRSSPTLASDIAALREENATLLAGIKRLSDEEEMLAETTDGDTFSLVTLAAQLASAEASESALREENKRLRNALEIIAKSETTVFDEELQCNVEQWLDDEEISSIARSALSQQGESR